MNCFIAGGVWQTDCRYWRWLRCSRRYSAEALEQMDPKALTNCCLSCYSPYRGPHYPSRVLTN